MLSRIISILFAMIAGAAALIGLTRGRDTTIGSNRISDQTTPKAPESLAPRQVGQNTVQVSPGGDDAPDSIFQNTISTDAGAVSTSTEAAIVDDPTPGANLPASTQPPAEPVAQSQPTTVTPDPAPAPAAAPAAAPNPQPVRAMW